MTDPIRVMRIIARLNTGGPAIHVTLLAQGLDRERDFETRLVTGMIGEDEGDMAPMARDRGVEPVMVPSLGREIALIEDVKTIRALSRMMREWRPHIVHTHTAKAGFVGRLAAWMNRVPVIVHTFHGHVFHGYFGRTKTQLFLTLERLAARASTAILTISEGLRDELIDYRIAPPKKVKVIPLGLDLDPFAACSSLRGQFRREMGLSTEHQLVGIIGRLVPIKNHELFLTAASQLQETHPKTRFVVVGDGERREALETFTRARGLDERVIFTGWRSDLPTIYADLDAVVITSKNEGTPVSIIEALAAGVPVVATAVGGVPDLLKQGQLGQLVPPGDANALAGGIRLVLNRPAPAPIEQARQWVMRYYHWDRLVTDIRALYLELLAGTGIKVTIS